MTEHHMGSRLAMSAKVSAVSARPFWRRPAAALTLRIVALAALAFMAASTILSPVAHADIAVPEASAPATAEMSATELQAKLEAALRDQRFLAGQVEELKDQLTRRNQQIADLASELETARQGKVAHAAFNPLGIKPSGVMPMAAGGGLVAGSAMASAGKPSVVSAAPSAELDLRSGLATLIVAIVLFTLWGMVRSRRTSSLSRRPGG
jgi:hypothetical protein